MLRGEEVTTAPRSVKAPFLCFHNLLSINSPAGVVDEAVGTVQSDKATQHKDLQ